MLKEESDITYQGHCFFWYLLRQVVYFIDMCHVICMNIGTPYRSDILLSILRKALFYYFYFLYHSMYIVHL